MSPSETASGQSLIFPPSWTAQLTGRVPMRRLRSPMHPASCGAPAAETSSRALAIVCGLGLFNGDAGFFQCGVERFYSAGLVAVDGIAQTTSAFYVEKAGKLIFKLDTFFLSLSRHRPQAEC